MAIATRRPLRAPAGLFLSLVLSLAWVGAGGGVAHAAKPLPVRGASCTIGGDTQAVWRHLSVATAELYWFDAPNSLLASATVDTHGRKGTVTRPTPTAAASLIVQFIHADGSSAGSATATCY